MPNDVFGNPCLLMEFFTPRDELASFKRDYLPMLEDNHFGFPGGPYDTMLEKMEGVTILVDRIMLNRSPSLDKPLVKATVFNVRGSMMLIVHFSFPSQFH